MTYPANRLIGIVGEGQLAKMLAQTAIRMGHRCAFWVEKTENIVANLGPCYQAPQHTFDAFCQAVDTVVIDYEHIPVAQIEVMAQYAPYNGQAQLLRQAQDRLLEKQLLVELDIPHAAFVAIDCAADFEKAIATLNYPLVFKKRRQAYDGKGQFVIKCAADLEKVRAEMTPGEYIAEQFVPFEAEYSLVSVRNQAGEIAAYDVAKNVHQSGILIESENVIAHPGREQLAAYNAAIAHACEYVGTFAVEYFWHNQQWLVNEISPRVHNTGHWTIEAAYCSQFENHIRACLGQPLGSTESYACAMMKNVIGCWEAVADVIQHPHARVHDYGKAPRPMRKLGHITVIQAKP